MQRCCLLQRQDSLQTAGGSRSGLLITAVRKPNSQVKRPKSSEEAVTRQRLSKVLTS
jgi:hypothetical protein